MANKKDETKETEIQETENKQEETKAPAKKAETKYIVGDQGYLYKEGKVYQTGEEISLTDEEVENVKHLVETAE